MSAPRTLEEWVLSLPKADRKRLSAILLLTPFAKEYMRMAWDAGAQEGVRRVYAMTGATVPATGADLDSLLRGLG